jgi:DNA primase
LDAVELLAKKAGVEIQREDGEQGGVNRETYFELNRRLAGSFHWLLCESPVAEAARAYLTGRSVGKEEIRSFQIGYAPADREWLKKFLKTKSYSDDFLAKTGLFSDSSGGRAALFANRIIFPIANARGEIVAFGGRALVDGVPKYLNSPETQFFRKGENLFGMDKALPAIRDTGTAVFVEGYMDVLAMHRAGVKNCIAPLGTALTDLQVRFLKRYAGRAVLVFDGDEAGRKATLRAVELMEKQDVEIRIVELSSRKDPADIVHMDGSFTMKSVMETAKPCFPYLLEKASTLYPGKTPESKEGIRDFIFPFIAALGSQVRADDYIKALAEEIGSAEDAVKADFHRWRNKGSKKPIGERRPAGAKGVSSDLFVFLAVAARQDLFPIVRNSGIAMEDLEDPTARELFVALEDTFRSEDTSFTALLERIEDPSLKDLLVGKIASGEFDQNQEKMIGDGVKRIKQRTLMKKRDGLATEMRRIESEKTDMARLKELLEEKMHLDDELAKLSGRTS